MVSRNSSVSTFKQCLCIPWLRLLGFGLLLKSTFVSGLRLSILILGLKFIPTGLLWFAFCFGVQTLRLPFAATSDSEPGYDMAMPA